MVTIYEIIMVRINRLRVLFSEAAVTALCAMFHKKTILSR